MYTKPPPETNERSTVGRRRLLAWIGGLGFVGVVGATALPRLAPAATSAGTEVAGGLVDQRLVYWHLEPDERAVGGHEHGDVFVEAADFDAPNALDAVVVYPEHLVGQEAYAIMLHRFDADAIGPEIDLALTDRGFVGYSAICPHCRMLLRWSAGETATGRGVDACPLHGCQFDPYRGGEAVGGPATGTLPQVGLAVNAGGVLELTAGPSWPVDRW